MREADCEGPGVAFRAAARVLPLAVRADICELSSSAGVLHLVLTPRNLVEA